MKIRRILTGFIVLGWMFTIGSFSAQNGSESTGLSMKAATMIVTVENKVFFQKWDKMQIEERANALQHPVRKLAHMSEYAVLSMLLAAHISCYSVTRKWIFIISFLIALLYAATDEIHQLFVSGRSGQLMDVGYDSTGALIGILLLWLGSKIKQSVSQ